MLRRLLLLALVLISSSMPALVWGQTYPSRAIRLVVPFPPGGGADPVARVLSQGLTASLGQPVVVENRPGAQGSIGTASVARAEPDGYTILLFVSALIADPLMSKSALFDPVKDFSYVSMVTSQPLLAVAPMHSSAGSLKDLVAMAQAKAGGLNFGYGSNSGRLSGELFKQITGANMTAVAYKGGGAAITDLVAGHIDLVVASPPSSIPLLKSGKLRGLAVVGSSRLPSIPEVPSATESGYPEFVVDAWYAVAAPVGTPNEIIGKLNAEIRKVLQTQAARDVLEREGLTPRTNSPAEMNDYVKLDYARWAKVVQDAGITPQ